MRRASILTVLLTALLVAPSAVLAQGGQEGSMGMEQRRKLQMIRPLPSAADVRQDVDQARDELQAEQRRNEIMRETLPRIEPPYADRDVRGGIQTQNLQRALPRR